MSAVAKLERTPVPMTLFDPAQFASLMHVAEFMAQSTLVPEAYRDKPANVLIALELASRMNASPLMIMQNLAVIDGRPSWSAVFVIAAIKSCGQFSPLDFEYEDLGEKTVQYVKYWQKNPQGKAQPIMAEMTIHDISCIAWATEKATGKRLESPEVTIEMAVKEGWYARAGSKWPNMPKLMLSYRAASFFGKRYAPELLMGMPTQDEAIDIKDAVTIAGSAETTGPTKTAGGVAGLKARLQPVAHAEPAPDSPPPAEPGPDFQALLSAIETSKTPEELEQYRPQVRALKGQEKRMAVAAWKEREAALTPPHDPVATIAAAIAAATSAEDLKALMPMFDPLSEDQVDAIYGQYTAKMESLIPSPSE